MLLMDKSKVETRQRRCLQSFRQTLEAVEFKCSWGTNDGTYPAPSSHEYAALVTMRKRSKLRITTISRHLSHSVFRKTGY
jgi:hypothetical protein